MLSCQVPLKMREIGTCKPEEQLLSWQWTISVHDQKGTVASRFSLYVDHRRVILFPRVILILMLFLFTRQSSWKVHVHTQQIVIEKVVFFVTSYDEPFQGDR